MQTPSSPARSATIVIPAFDAADSIASTLSKLRLELAPLCEALELIVVDDGSRDSTAAIVANIATEDRAVRVLRNTGNLGKGLSVYRGILAAQHSTVCFVDADLPFTHGSCAKVLQLALDGHPFVVGSRRLAESEILVRMGVLGYAARRHFVGVAFNTLARLVLALPYRDTQCGLKAFRRDTAIALFQRLRSPRFLFDIELLVAARELATAVVEVPVCMAYNDFKSSVRLAQDSTRMLAGVLAIARRSRGGVYRTANPAMDPAVVAHHAP